MLTQLQQDYRHLAEVSFSQNELGVIFIHVHSEHAKAELCLQGGHVCQFQPQGEEPVIWMSETALFQPNKAIRGGVPICWPWFGPHPTNNQLPQHGFVRNQAWQLAGINKLADGQLVIELCLQDNQTTREIWPYSFDLRMKVQIGQQLEMQLITTNTGDREFTLGGALHTYFAIADIAQTRVEGLAKTYFDDKVSGETKVLQQGDVLIDQEVDRVYVNTASDCFIHDDGHQRCIKVSKSGSQTTVVWNPWQQKAATMADFDDEGYQHMLCIEAVNSRDEKVQLAKGQQHALSQIISVLPHD